MIESDFIMRGNPRGRIDCVLNLCAAVLCFLTFALPSRVALSQSLLQQMIQDAQQKESGRQQQIQQQQQQQLRQQQMQDEQARQQAAAQAEEQSRLITVKQSWLSLDTNVRMCVDRRLQGAGQSIAVLEKQAVSASDPRVQEVISGCNAISAQRLLKLVPCAFDGASSVCNEEYVLINYPDVPLSADQVVTAFVAGRSAEIGTSQIEDPKEKAKRLGAVEARRTRGVVDQLVQKLALIAVPNNTFSFKSATALEKTLAAAGGSSNTTNDQLQRWSSEVDRLVAADRDEKLRLEKLKADMLARGEVNVAGNGTGVNQKAARINAYYDIFLGQLRSMVGGQADTEIGTQFRKSADADFDKFRAAYFASETADNCAAVKPAVKCDVKGIFKVNALKADVQKIMDATVGSGAHDYRFILRYPQSDDEATDFLIAQISSAFINSGYKIISKGGEDEAEARGAFDFYLNILEVGQDSSQDVGGNFVTYNLKARIKLITNDKDPAKQQDLANVPLVNTKRIIRDPKTPLAARAKELLQIQGNELARTILQEVNSRILTLQSKRTHPPATATAGDPAPRWYFVQIAGISQRERERIRTLRDVISNSLKLATPTTVDSDATNETGVQVNFQPPDRFDPEDLVDALYDAFKDNKKFKIRFDGKNTFVGSM